MTTDGERIAALEVEVKHMSENMAEMAVQLKEVHDLLLKAKGAKWAILAIAAIGGGIGAKVTALLPAALK